MPPVSASRQFEIIAGALALAEERGGVPLADAAQRVGVSTEQLRKLLEPVLFLEFRDGLGVLIDESRAFFLDVSSDVLQVDEGHWLRDWDASAPSRDAALRLLVAATVYQASAEQPSDALDSALAKLRQLVAIDMVVPVDRPPAFNIAERARREGRSLRFRYTKWKDDAATDREVFPWDVYGKWGHWFVHGPEVGGGEAKSWRVDRMDAAVVGAGRFDPPDELAEQTWFDLSEHRHRVVVRVPTGLLAALPQPRTVISRIDEPGGMVRAEIEVSGERQLDHLLVALGPDGEVLDPPDAKTRRSARARALLDAINAP